MLAIIIIISVCVIICEREREWESGFWGLLSTSQPTWCCSCLWGPRLNAIVQRPNHAAGAVRGQSSSSSHPQLDSGRGPKGTGGQEGGTSGL